MRAVVAAACALAGCAASFADRFAEGSAAMNTPQGAAYLVGFSPILHRALNACRAIGEPYPSAVMALVARVSARGEPRDVVVEPASAATDCLERELRDATFPAPPLSPGAHHFPIGLRIDDAR